ncbi:TPA: thioredoxin domain-containing protein [Salmonella enterica subsp. enterica serovar Panama]|nr:thioredoxin domain-containing protein [Salmonella enterica subsp. enterica serovar Panama]
MLAAGLLVSGVAGAAEKSAAAFTPEQEARIGEIAKDYLLAHPEVLVEVSQKLQAQQQEKQQAMTAAVIQNQAALLNDKGTPSYGPADAKVTVVEFFDYQCIYCARLAPELEKVIKASPDVRFVFKEFPIFGQRWPASLSAAKTGLQVWKRKGADAYLHYHNAIYATGHNEGKLTDADISAAAKAVKFDAKTAHDVQGTLDGINTLAQQLGFSGTPALVVLLSTGASADNVTVIPGYTSAEALLQAIRHAAGDTKK